LANRAEAGCNCGAEITIIAAAALVTLQTRSAVLADNAIIIFLTDGICWWSIAIACCSYY
jgi:hypothetical protein